MWLINQRFKIHLYPCSIFVIFVIVFVVQNTKNSLLFVSHYIAPTYFHLSSINHLTKDHTQLFSTQNENKFHSTPMKSNRNSIDITWRNDFYNNYKKDQQRMLHIDSKNSTSSSKIYILFRYPERRISFALCPNKVGET